VHDRLHVSNNPSAVALDTYLEGLCGDLAASAQVHCAINSDAIIVPSTQAVALGLIVTELMLNVAKHAGGSDVRLEVGARSRPVAWSLPSGTTVAAFAQDSIPSRTPVSVCAL
jgi:two-component sensor histidine kinase